MNRDTYFILHKTAGLLVPMLLLVWLFKRMVGLWRDRVFRIRGMAFFHLLIAGVFGFTALLGWAGSSAGDYGQSLFGVIPLPNIVAERDIAYALTLYNDHKQWAWIFLLLLGLHIAGALFHALVLKDGSLRRMWFWSEK